MIVDKLRELKRFKELVAFSGRLDDSLPKTPDKIMRELDGKLFYIQHIFVFTVNPECQDLILLVIADPDKYLKEGDDITILGENSGYQDDFFARHNIPGGYWQGIHNGEPQTYKCSGYCQLCGQKCNKERHF